MSLPSNQGADSEPSSSSYPSQLCREFTLPEIELATQNFDESRLLGSGGFAKVYRGTITYGKRRVDVAIKRLNPGSCEGSSQFWYEVAMLSKLRNPYLVSLIGYCNDGQEMIFVYDYMPRGTLEHCLHEGGSPLSWAHRLKICIHVASGLEYLHSETDTKPMILHLDVKSSNILLDFNGAAKLSDFGLSKVRPADSAYVTDHVGGTLGYLDPHFQLTGEATRKTDVFAFGVIMFEVLCGKKAYPSINGTRQFLRAWAQDSIKKGRLKQIIDPNLADKISSKCLKKFVALAEKCLHSRPMLRPTMAEVVKDLEFIMDLHEKAERASYEENSAMKNQQLSLEKLLKEFYIPDYILVSHGTVEVLPVQPKCPILVFINSKSGDQLGGELLVTYRAVLNPNQVFDLGEEAPDKVLHRLYLTLAALKLNGDEFAAKIEKHLRLIVAGGDGTASWLLGVISDLKLAHPPPIATMPLGTGNNLPFALGWGKKNPGTDRRSVLKFLEQVLEGKEMEIDSWHILMRMKSTPEERSCDHISPLELPHSLHTFDRMTDIDELNVSGYDTYRGGFWNYFSIGMDAQVSYAFHLERKLHPEKFKNQLTNRIGSPQGWFAASLFQPSSKNIAQSMRVQIMARHGGWKKLQIPHNIRSIVCLNLPSFSGGLNPWGTPNRSKTVNQDITPPYVDDGLLEVVGFRDPWHGLLLLAPKGHRTRLAQTHRVRFMFYKCEADCTYMRMDGEPWKQPLPADDQSDMTVEISYHGQVHMLATQTCISKSIRDPFVVEEEDDDDDDDNDYYGKTPSGEAWSKIGAAERFMIPEEIDISHLS